MQHDAKTVTTASQVLVDKSTLGEATYVLIQNTHASNKLYVRLDGATATALNGILIDAGKALELESPGGRPLNQDITGIADAASTTVILAYATNG